MRKLLLSMVIPLALVAFSCQNQPTTPDSPDTGDTSTEIPVTVRALLEFHAPDDDLLITLDRSDSATPNPSDTGYDVYAVTLIWGTFLAPGSTTDSIDWSGVAYVNGEFHIRPIVTIDFEEGQDGLLPDPPALGWHSVTNGDFDGVSFLLFMRRGIDYFVAPWLTIDTGPVTLEIPVYELDRYFAFHPVDMQSGMAVAARRIRYPPCDYGLIAGEWIKADSSESEGQFEGLWLDKYDEPVGVVAGTFWTDVNGRGHLEGVVSGGLTTQVIIELLGTWLYDDDRICPSPWCGTSHGQFHGRWRSIVDDSHGRFVGEFGDLTIVFDTRQLPMSGVWTQNCDHLAGDYVWATD